MSVGKIPLRKKLAFKLYDRYRRNETRMHQLNYILWESTLRCNLNCRHCGSDCKKDAAQKDMPAEDFLRAIDEITPIVNPNKTMIVFTGGEALMRKDLEEVGQELYNRGFPWGVVSNGMLFTEKRLLSLIDAGLRSVTISLDGLESAHNWLRGHPKSYEKALHALGLLTQTQHLAYDVVTCVHSNNYEGLPQMRDKLIAMGVEAWRIFTVFPIGRAAQDQELQLNAKEFKALFDFIKETREEGKIKLNYGCEGFLGNYEGEVRDNFFFCRAGVNIASILVDGSISACPNLRENFIQGNIYQDNFAKVWQTRYQKYRNRNWTKTGICKTCPHFSHCQGNGMHLRDEKTGELLFCHLKRLEEGEKNNP